MNIFIILFQNTHRVVTVHKNDDDEMKKIILNDISLNSTKDEIVDADAAEKDVNGNLHIENHHQMTFDSLKDQDPGKMHYDLPYGLYERLQSNDGIDAKKEIMKILASYIPERLNYETYQVCVATIFLNCVSSFIQNIFANKIPYYYFRNIEMVSCLNFLGGN